MKTILAWGVGGTVAVIVVGGLCGAVFVSLIVMVVQSRRNARRIGEWFEGGNVGSR